MSYSRCRPPFHRKTCHFAFRNRPYRGAKRPVSECNRGRFAMRYGPFRNMKRPVLGCNGPFPASRRCIFPFSGAWKFLFQRKRNVKFRYIFTTSLPHVQPFPNHLHTTWNTPRHNAPRPVRKHTFATSTCQIAPHIPYIY